MKGVLPEQRREIIADLQLAGKQSSYDSLHGALREGRDILVYSAESVTGGNKAAALFHKGKTYALLVPSMNDGHKLHLKRLYELGYVNILVPDITWLKGDKILKGLLTLDGVRLTVLEGGVAMLAQRQLDHVLEPLDIAKTVIDRFCQLERDRERASEIGRTQSA